jgi:multiple sugar transport system permease protein
MSHGLDDEVVAERLQQDVTRQPSSPGEVRQERDRRVPRWVVAVQRSAVSATDQWFFRFAMIPAFLVVFLVTVVPLISGFGLSFSSMNSTHNAVLPLTLRNYREIFSDPVTHTVVINTIVYVVLAVGLEIGFGLLLAILLAQKFRSVSVFRVIFMLPLTVAGIAAAVSWGSMLNTSEGWINYFLGLVHLPQPNWLASTGTAMVSVIVADVWTGVPVVAVVVLAALLSAPAEPLEAARVDGASAWSRFRYVTFPAIRPAVALAALLRTVTAFQQFALFQAMTGGGPGLATTVINYYVYQQSVVYNNAGYGAALGLMLVAIMAVPLTGLFILARRR